MTAPARASRPDTGRRAGLTPDVVASAAVDLVDDEGLGALTMRRLADRLGVTPMALYNHVRNRAELESLVVGRVLAGTAVRRTDTAPVDELRSVAHSLRATYLRHPNVVPLVQTTSATGADALRPIDHAASALLRGGLAPEAASHAWIGLVALVNGHVGYQLRGHFADPTNAEQVPETMVALCEVLSAAPVDYDVAFSNALDAYLGGLGM